MSESSVALSDEVFVSEQIPTTGKLPTGGPQLWSPMSTTLISGATDAVLIKKPTPREFFDEMNRRYPHRVNPGTVWLNAQRMP